MASVAIRSCNPVMASASRALRHAKTVPMVATVGRHSAAPFVLVKACFTTNCYHYTRSSSFSKVGDFHLSDFLFSKGVPKTEHPKR